MAFPILLVVLYVSALTFIFLTKYYQSLWYYGLAGLVLLSISIVISPTAWIFLSILSSDCLTFPALFLFRYARLVVNLIGFCLYKPAAVPRRPSLKPSDVSVIVPTVEGEGEEFLECIRSVYVNKPAKIIIVTAGPDIYNRALKSVSAYENIVIKNCSVQNKRRQVCVGLQEVTTEITVLCDDHVFWPPTFLPHLLAPFSDPTVGSVGTRKRVRRTTPGLSPASFWNLLGCLYLERHNFEITATNAVDGGVFVISGRTSAHRSSILLSRRFQSAFVAEYLFPFPSFLPTKTGGIIGPLNADDDNFITRWMVSHNWKLRIQYSDAATIETTLGSYPKFLSQCLRWSRTTWRSNPRASLDFRTWLRQPYCVYAVYVSSFVNFALVWDPLLVYTFRCACTSSSSPSSSSLINIDRKDLGTITLLTWILFSKLVKTVPHFKRHPADLIWLPACILFGYVHSVMKLWALLTFWDVSWGSRELMDESESGDVGDEEEEEEEDEEEEDEEEGEGEMGGNELMQWLVEG